MPINPAAPQPSSLEGRLLDRVAQLERKMANLETMLAGGSVQIPAVDTLPAAGRPGRLVYLTSDGLVYKDTGSGWANPV